MTSYDDWLERPPMRRIDSEELESMLASKFEEGYEEARKEVIAALNGLRHKGWSDAHEAVCRTLKIEPEEIVSEEEDE